MNKIAIISDIHSNYSALTAVLDNIKKKNVEKIICLGDIVTRCANPDLVIDVLRKEADVIIKGNCDDIVYKNTNYKWTRNQLGEERLEFLNSLPILYEFYLSGHLIRLFHASPYSLEHVYNPMFSNSETRYKDKEILSADEMFLNTEFLGKTSEDPAPDVVGYGHLHTPNIVRFKNKTLFNPGSVGCPVEMANDDPNSSSNKFSTMASYMILEGNLNSKVLDEISFNLIRVPYDIEKEIKDMENKKMPNFDKIAYSLRTASYKN